MMIYHICGRSLILSISLTSPTIFFKCIFGNALRFWLSDPFSDKKNYQLTPFCFLLQSLAGNLILNYFLEHFFYFSDRNYCSSWAVSSMFCSEAIPRWSSWKYTIKKWRENMLRQTWTCIQLCSKSKFSYTKYLSLILTQTLNYSKRIYFRDKETQRYV